MGGGCSQGSKSPQAHCGVDMVIDGVKIKVSLYVSQLFSSAVCRDKKNHLFIPGDLTLAILKQKEFLNTKAII